MTQKIEQLVELKVATALFHGTFENDEYLITGILNDACYNSQRAVQMKKDWWNSKIEEASGYEMESQRADSNDAKNVATNNYERIVQMLTRIRENFTNELEQLKMRHQADLMAYKQVTGNAWEPRKPAARPAKKASLATLGKVAA